MSTALRRALPYAFGVCLLLLAVLSWLPGEELPRTGLAGKIEHFVAYAGTMLLGGLAWPARRHAPPLIGGLCAYAAMMELGQLVAPGRHASVWDFLAGAAGVVTTAVLLRLLTPRPA
ncbi:MAG: VanZ family protein [Alphaproteobacteria bacterium]|nr:VanZ family protein [Alphaproteobacteria bacterium]MCW5740698.1 VanZ family protein [Alphaproteobacteria bacterium]